MNSDSVYTKTKRDPKGIRAVGALFFLGILLYIGFFKFSK